MHFSFVARCRPYPMKRLPKSALLRARCQPGLKDELERIALIQNLDLSDVIRIACHCYADRAKRRQSRFDYAA